MTTSEIEETIMALQDRVRLLGRCRSPSLKKAQSALRQLAAVRRRRFRRESQDARSQEGGGVRSETG